MSKLSLLYVIYWTNNTSPKRIAQEKEKKCDGQVSPKLKWPFIVCLLSLLWLLAITLFY
jgi:hypothetical protein